MLTQRHIRIIRGLCSVRHYTGRCNQCNIKRVHPLRQLMADLPTFRIAVYKKTFANTSCGCFGLFMFKEKRNVKKTWGILFTCMTPRTIHVELATSMDLSNFILAFFRFVHI